MSSSIKGSGAGRGGLITVAPSVGVSSCETSGSSSESKRTTRSRYVLDANVRNRVIAKVGSWVLVSLGTSNERNVPTQVNFSRVLQVPK